MKKEHLARLPFAVKIALDKKRLKCVAGQTREQILRPIKERRATFNAMHESVVLLDTDRKILRCNTDLCASLSLKNERQLAEVSERWFAGEIIGETEHMARIVSNLLSFARHERQPRNLVRGCNIVGSALSLVRTIIHGDQITMDVNVPEEPPKIKCGSQPIQQLITNLLTNARDTLNEKYPAYDENKQISITAHVVEKEGREWVRTTVEDSGKGVPIEIIARIFDPFYTTKPRDIGRGLGLSISYGIVEEQGGKLKR
jgi:C4-dicarboxylate-specific signal transduction histidine kinase